MKMGDPFAEGEFEFTFPNNDKYVGHFGAHRNGLAWRQGPGIYYTHEGQTYDGTWKDDKLDESKNVHITFQDGDQYIGRISKYKYKGPGEYFFSNGALSCTFLGNKPIGEVIFVDYHDKMWYGVAEQEHVLLNREHVFSYELDSERGKGAPLKPPPIEYTLEDVELEAEIHEEFDMKELEKLIFAKTKKTPSEIDFTDSEWLKECEKMNEEYNRIIEKIKEQGTRNLSNSEKNLYRQYIHSARLVEDHKTKEVKQKEPRHTLLKDYLFEKLKDTCPPTAVFYPIQIGEQEEQLEQ